MSGETHREVGGEVGADPVVSSRCRSQPLPEIPFKTHRRPRTGAYSTIPAVQAPTKLPHRNDSPLLPPPPI